VELSTVVLQSLKCAESGFCFGLLFIIDQVLGKEVYYESIKREPKITGINKCRCDERLQTKTKEFTRLPYTGLVLELEHLKIETRLISERFANAMGEKVWRFLVFFPLCFLFVFLFL
jgi:hypothetical protein